MSETRVLAYNTEGACQALGIKKSSLYKLIKERKLEARALGGKTVILADSMQRFLDSLPAAPISDYAA